MFFSVFSPSQTTKINIFNKIYVPRTATPPRYWTVSLCKVLSQLSNTVFACHRCSRRSRITTPSKIAREFRTKDSVLSVESTLLIFIFSVNFCWPCFFVYFYFILGENQQFKQNKSKRTEKNTKRSSLENMFKSGQMFFCFSTPTIP